MSSASVSRAGPRARSRRVDRGRLDCAISSPSTISPARSRTADATSGRSADQVDAEVHAVGEVDVGVAGRPEHHGVARRRTAEGMRCRVVRAVVRLDLGEPKPHAVSRRRSHRAGRERPRGPAGRRTTAAGAGREAGSRVAGPLLVVRDGPCNARRAAQPPGPAQSRRAPIGRRAHRGPTARRERRASGASLIVARSASETSCRSHSLTAHQTTRCPTASWASRNGTPRRTRCSATSVASANPSAAVRRAGRRRSSSSRPCRPRRAARAATCRQRRRPAPCPPAGPGRRPAAGPSARPAAR